MDRGVFWTVKKWVEATLFPSNFRVQLKSFDLPKMTGTEIDLVFLFDNFYFFYYRQMGFTIFPILAAYGPYLERISPQENGYDQLAILHAYYLIIRILAKKDLMLEDIDIVKELIREISIL